PPVRCALRHEREMVSGEVFTPFLPPSSQIALHTADSKPFRMHATNADGFDDRKGSFAVIERIEHGGHLPQVLRQSAVPDQMAVDAKQFRQHHANDLCSGWNLYTGQALQPPWLP